MGDRRDTFTWLFPWGSFRLALRDVDDTACDMAMLPDVPPERVARLKELRTWASDMWSEIGMERLTMPPRQLEDQIRAALAYMEEDPRGRCPVMEEWKARGLV